MFATGSDAHNIAGAIVMKEAAGAALHGIGAGRNDKVKTRTKFRVGIIEVAIVVEGLDGKPAVKL
jgi:hypothetical protein